MKKNITVGVILFMLSLSSLSAQDSLRIGTAVEKASSETFKAPESEMGAGKEASPGHFHPVGQLLYCIF